MSNRIERLTIVGGGTAGWLTALILNNALNKGRSIAISLIESPNVPTIGVGESTIQNMKNTLQGANVDEAEFIRRSNASFKLGVRYIDWSRGGGVAASQFFHPLNNPPACGGLHPAYHYRRFGPPWLGASFGESVLPNAAVIAAGRGPRQIHAPGYSWDINYAYHVDAALFADFMRELCVKRGVEHIRDDVVDVTHDESGAISALQLQQRGKYPVEFVVDCTGFKSLIRSRMGGEPFVSANDRLLNDRAIPLQLEHPEPGKVEPCTRAIALGAGWAWRVPLYSRVGTGYVYSSAFRSDDEARSEFIAHLRKSGDLPQGAPEPDTRVIQMRVGYSREPWVKNCVAIGLSSGFVEPLEATAIYTIDAAAHRLVMNFPGKDCNPAFARAYNARSTALMEEIVDFLQINYLTSNRTDPYWQAVRGQTRISDWLRDKMDLWTQRFPDMDDTHKNVLFDFSNFIYALSPKGYFAKFTSPLDGTLQAEHWKAYGQNVQLETGRLLKILPSHHDLLTQIRTGPRSETPALRLPAGSASAGRMRGAVVQPG